ncbi:Rieske 2Fe-2S domain-containing protein [Rhodococcus sp. (in: high G+C Gram-positive bacteria)]|uniref:Rieske 2Fe-2S domain-containing protein n=1 Tax=Rhodococcus sp. TaxID=1831 RepID=UPI00388F4E7C
MTAWLPVALGRDIEPGAATGTTLNGVSIALWRDARGTLHAWGDRCPHRGMRLSFGFVREDRLVCLYHGWQFDGSGACRHVPAHPRMEPPGTVRTTRYRVLERSGLVWVNDPAGADDEDLPVLPAAPITPVRSVWIRARREDVLQRLRTAITDVEDNGAFFVGVLDSHDVLVACQVIDAHTTAVHMVSLGTPPATATVQGLVRRLHEIRDGAAVCATADAS